MNIQFTIQIRTENSWIIKKKLLNMHKKDENSLNNCNLYSLSRWFTLILSHYEKQNTRELKNFFQSLCLELKA